MGKITKTVTINGKQVKKYFKTIEEKEKWFNSFIFNNNDKFDNCEIWKTIPNFSNYEASSKGRLRSLNYKRSGLIKIIHPIIAKDGYLKTMLLSDDGKYKSWTVHLFICLAFYGLKPEGLEINHKDGIKTNCCPDNLEYCTRSFNCKHAIDNNLWIPRNGKLNGMAKLTENDVIFIRSEAKNKGRFYGRKNLSIKYNISEGQIKHIVNNKTSWKGV